MENRFTIYWRNLKTNTFLFESKLFIASDVCLFN